jgi:hypothetical protein
MAEVAAEKKPESPKKVTRPAQDRVIIRPWPKIIFLYPSFVLGVLFWVMSFFTVDTPDAGNRTMGWIFMVVFCANLLVFAFDFSRIKTITLFILIVAIVLGLGWASTSTSWQIVPFIRGVLNEVDIRMNTQFYGFFACFFAFVYLLILVNTRFNYYEINRNEILHHHGYLGDITRMPTASIKMNKEIYDLFEYLLLRSGRLIFYPSTAREALVLDNIVAVNKVEARIQALLSSVSVAIHREEEQHSHV